MKKYLLISALSIFNFISASTTQYILKLNSKEVINTQLRLEKNELYKGAVSKWSKFEIGLTIDKIIKDNSIILTSIIYDDYKFIGSPKITVGANQTGSLLFKCDNDKKFELIVTHKY